MITRARMLIASALLLVVVLIGIAVIPHTPDIAAREHGVEETSGGYIHWLQQTLADPATGKIPEGIFQRSLDFAATLPVEPDRQSKADHGIWVQRGPNFIGGRTRALAIDVDHEARMISGQGSGGIWKSEDGGGSWQKMSADTDLVPLSCIIQDTRKSKTSTWYAGTGEYYGSGIPTGQFLIGNGIRKSTDQGKTWQRLASTYSSNQVTPTSFSFVHRLAINPAIDSIDVVFAAVIDGIMRSTDGGKTWLRKKGSGNSWGYTDVAVDKNGVVYAALDGGNAQPGIWRSMDNGQTWSNISPSWFSTSSGRIVMTISPDDPRQLYFLSYSPGTGKKTQPDEWYSLWKYTYVSGDGTGSGGIWEDRSNSIPTDTTQTYGTFHAQKGYCMHVRVRPGHPEEVYLGGVDLFRSTDGFQTTNHITHIGGIKLDLKDNDLLILVPNQHGDEHDLVFFPSNPKKAIALSDGGIEYTNDIGASPVVWNTMNAGYVTTQFYSVGIKHHSTDFIVFGGAQDNGALFTNTMDYTKAWSIPSDGDGMQIFEGPADDEYYIAFQNGWLGRFKLDANLNTAQVAYLTPKVYSPITLFYSPYLVDESNRKRLYFADGQFLQRNDDITQIPMKSTIDYSPSTIVGWNLMQGCVAPDSSSITQLTYAQAQTDVVYFGTNTGKLMRIRQASTANPLIENITGSNFPAGYITSIATDPQDSNKLFCVFSNFSILSVFYSNDGGASWTAVSGNLEQNANGTGAGPSCRWITIAHLPDTTLYFLGTSTGLYATTQIQGSNTIWVRQGPHSIGLNWINMMDFRTLDYTLAVATYGAGIYTAQISSADHTGLATLYQEQQVKVYPNPANDQIRIQLPDHWLTTPYEIIDMKGATISKGVYRKEEAIDITALHSGQYLLRLRQKSVVLTKKLSVERE